MRVRGVGAFSATASGDGGCIAAESIRSPFSIPPVRPLQAAAGSPVIFAAIAWEAENDVAAASAARRAHARVLIDKPCIVFLAMLLLSLCADVQPRQHGRRNAGVKLPASRVSSSP